MAARPPKEVTAANEREAWRLRVERHLTQEQIAELLEVDISTVSRMLRRQEQRLTKEFTDHALLVKARQTAQLEEIARGAMMGWERSLEDAVMERTVSTNDGDQHVTERRGQSGNPQLLAQAREALADVRAIWGLDAPRKQDVTSGGAPLVIREVVVEMPATTEDEPADGSDSSERTGGEPAEEPLAD